MFGNLHKFWRWGWVLLLPGLAWADGTTSAAQVARELREGGFDANECYRVRDFSFSRDDVKLFFNDGYLIFAKPVEGRRYAALFSADVEGGDGEIIVIPPNRDERQSLAAYTHSPNLDEHFRAAMVISSTGLEDSLLARVRMDAGAKRSPENGAVLAQQWAPALAGLAARMQMRLVANPLTPVARVAGLNLFAVSGKTLGAFDVISDDRSNRRIEVRQALVRDGREYVNIWTSFLPRSVRNRVSNKAAGTEAKRPADFLLPHYAIDVQIDSDLVVKARTQIAIRVGAAAPVRVLPFEIASAMRVTAVRVDGMPAEILRDPTYRSRESANGVEDEFLVVPGGELAAGSDHEIEFEHEGNVIATRGDGVYYVDARGSWYPHVGGTFSTYDLKFRYPKRLTLVAAGEGLEERVEGESKFTHRQVNLPIGAAGFNLGAYEKVTGTAAGVAYEVYGNRNLETSLRPLVMAEAIPAAPRVYVPHGGHLEPTPPPVLQPDPLGRLKLVASDVASSLEFFSNLLGPAPLKTLTVAPIPGTFGQGFPGLVYLSTFAYLNTMERPAALRSAREQVFFSDLLVPHEAAHQWWGGVVTTNQREDSWLVEALANYSALMWLEKKKGFRAVQDVLDGYRAELLSKDTNGVVRESAGPVVWGDRLESVPVDGAWRVITYDKGTWILHMLRRRLGDEAFLKLLKTIRTRYEFQVFSTAELQAMARELRPKNVSAEAIDTFFDSWVYRTGIPSIKLSSGVKGAAPALKLTGFIEQREVQEDFSADIPVEIQSGRGAVQTVWVRSGGESRNFSANITQPMAHAAIPNDVLVRR